MSEQDAPFTNIHEVEISYSQETLTEKLQSQQLNPEYVYTKLSVDKARLKAFQKETHTNSNLFNLCQSLINWRQKNDAMHFSADINELVYLWMNAIEDGEQMQAVLNILNCFRLKPLLRFSKSINFHLFLHQLVIESMQRHQTAALDYLLNYDEDTQLPNANQIIPNLEVIFNNTDNKKITAALSLHFQTASNNFLLPKLVATNLNRQLAGMLKDILIDSAQIYFNGDSQFDILLPKVESETQLELIVVKIFGAFEELIFINKQSILLKPFIGCSYTVNHQTINAQELHQNAKLALEQAIITKKNHVLYDDALEQSISNQIILESKVLDAFDSNNLALYCQPIIDLKKNKCVGAELLLRWSDKFGKNIAPSFIIETLNNVGKGKLFTRWLVNSACRYIHELNNVHQLGIYLTINLRAEDLYDIELPSLFANALSLWKLNSENIILEITENGILEQNNNTTTVINNLSEMGFKFALDDFGTGFSSLTRLRTLPINLIKVDQSFVKDINNSKEDYKIVESIAMLANSLGKEVLAEGVEDEACLALIKQLKIEKCQGYHFAKPMPYEEFIEWVKAY